MKLSNDAGFTLIEMLVALAIIGMMFAFIASIIGYGQSLLGRMTDDDNRLSGRLVTWRLLSDTLSQVVVTGDGGLSGTAHSLALLAYGPRSLGLSAPTEILFEADQGSRGLLVAWTNVSGSNEIKRRLLDDETDVAFSYFSASRGWVSDWSAKDVLPSLVRLRLGPERQNMMAALTLRVRRLLPAKCFVSPHAGCEDTQ